MPASRGDTKPCTVPDCAGTMQYGRRLDSGTRTTPASPNMATGAGAEPAVVRIFRLRVSGRVEAAHLGWMSEHWLAEHRAADSF